MRRTGFVLAAMLTALLMVSGVALAKEILCTPKNDSITGTDRGDVVSARGGTDTVVGRGGDDELYGQPGGDSISGSEDDDDVYGDDGADNLNGGGIDELSGGNNNDTINALGGGRDSINCGLGSDDQVIADEVDGVNINDCGKITQE